MYDDTQTATPGLWREPTTLHYDEPEDWYVDHTYEDRLSGRHRLRLSAYVDGRLVDSWTEPVDGTRWQPHADRHDAEHTPPPPPAPPVPAWQRTLDWLCAVAGGATALAELTAEPAPEEPPDLSALDLPTRTLVSSTRVPLERLESVAPEEEMAAVRRCLRLLWQEASTPARLPSGTPLVAGAAWIVGKTNGWFGAGGWLPQSALAEALEISNLSNAGQRLKRHLIDPWPHVMTPRFTFAAEIEPYGRPELLTPSLRRRLVRLRDRAYADRDAAAAA